MTERRFIDSLNWDALVAPGVMGCKDGSLLARRGVAGIDSESHALEYLRRTGFRIDETGQGGVSFDISIDRMEDGDVAAVAEIGGSLRISRMYTPVQTGVRAASAVTVQQLDPDTHLARGARW